MGLCFSPGALTLMGPDPLADELPLTLTPEKTHAAREARSPRTQLAWLFAVTLIGFSVTNAAIWFGPRTVGYLREVASRSSDVGPKSGPTTVLKFKPVWNSENPPIIYPPSIPQFNIHQGNGFSAPSSGRGVGLPIATEKKTTIFGMTVVQRRSRERWFLRTAKHLRRVHEIPRDFDSR